MADPNPFNTIDPPKETPGKKADKGYFGGMLGRYGEEVGQAYEQLKQDVTAAYAPQTAQEKADSGAGKLRASPRLTAADQLGGDIGNLGNAALLTGPIRALTGASHEQAAVAPTVVGYLAPGAARAPLAREGASLVPPSGPRFPQLKENVETLKKAGIEPSLAVATPSRAIRKTEEALSGNLAGGLTARKALTKTVEGAEKSAAETAKTIGAPKTATAAGEQLQEGVKRFSQSTPGAAAARDSLSPEAAALVEKAARAAPSRQIGFSNKADILYERADRLVGRPNANIELPNLREALGEASLRFSDPHMQELFQNSEIAELSQRLERSNGQLSWNDARMLRTTIRNKLMSEGERLKGTVDTAEVDRIYGALTQDLREGAAKLGGDPAAKAYDEANKFYYAGRQRMDNALESVFQAKTGDQVFYSLWKNAESGGRRNLEKLQQVKRSVSPEEWNDFSASVLEHMGVTKDGKRTSEQPFSMSTFLTNFNHLDPPAGVRVESGSDTGLKVLFQGSGRGDTYEKIQALARSAELMRDLEKYRNWSRSGEHMGDLLTLGGAALNLKATMITALTGNAVGKALESPHFVEWLANLPEKGDVAGLSTALDKLGKLAHKDAAIAPIYYLVGSKLAEPIAEAKTQQEIHGPEKEDKNPFDDLDPRSTDKTDTPKSPQEISDAEPSDAVGALLNKVVGLEASADQAVSPKGAIGRYQITPDTAKTYKIDVNRLTDPVYSKRAATKILTDLNNRYNGDEGAILVAYNAGPGRADEWLAAGRDPSVLPEETRKYLQRGGDLASGGDDDFQALISQYAPKG